MFDGWRIRTLIPICKNKRDTQSCANYNGLSSWTILRNVEEGSWAEIKTRDSYYWKPIWFIIWEVDNGSNILATLIHGVIFEESKRLTYGWFGKDIQQGANVGRL